LFGFDSHVSLSLAEETMNMFKGGVCHGGHHFGGVLGANLRHHHWTGTTDNFPRTNGVPPVDGGLEPKPGPWKRFRSWFKFIGAQLGREYTEWKYRRSLGR
jgi:hypothetical protein